MIDQSSSGVIAAFYKECHVIGTPEQDQRLLLLFALEKTLRKGYSLLGIGYLERL